jgi:hypothetical protein
LWICLSHLWRDWRSALAIVKPETVIAWHRAGFRLFWTWKVGRGQLGRPAISREIRDLICKMCRENPDWGAPRIHGELLKLGIDIGGSSVSKYMVRCRKPPSQTCRTFLENHAQQLVCCGTAMPSLAMISENKCETWASAKFCLCRAHLGSEPMWNE